MGYYGIGEQLSIAISMLYTKLMFRKSRLIRLPFYIRGKKYIDIGKGVTTGYRCRFEVDGEHEGKCLIIGNNVSFGDDNRISCSEYIKIGDNVLLAGKVVIVDNSHGRYKNENQSSPMISPNNREVVSSPIIIEDNVWIGEGAIIQQGVTIGAGAIIGANSVVTRSIDRNTIAAGSPAKNIKKYNWSNSTWESCK